MGSISSDFKRRLLANDDAAWHDLDRDFGRFITAGIQAEARAGFSPLTVQDLRQEVMALLHGNLEKFDASRGSSFSSWLYSFGRFAARNYRAKFMAGKRGSGARPGELTGEEREIPDHEPDAGHFAVFEAQVFRAKVMRAVRLVQAQLPFNDFQAYYLKVTSGRSGAEIAGLYGVSQATVTRQQQRVRELMRAEIEKAVREFSWDEAESGQASERGLTRSDDAAFDEALSGILRSAEAIPEVPGWTTGK